MARLAITHGVVDIDNWLKGKVERAGAIAGMGGTNVVDHVAYDGSNMVAISADFDDVEGVMATLADPPAEMAALMQAHGVVPPLTAYVEK
jgi:hypothetical protein